MDIQNVIQSACAKAVEALYGAKVELEQLQLQKTKKEFEGHLTLVVFPLLRVSRKKPEDTAQEIGQWLVDNEPAVDKFNVIKGFLNLSVSTTSWTRLLNTIASTADYGMVKPTAQSPLVMIEYSSPNTNKPLHLGHVRNNLLGWAISQIQ